MGILDWLGRSGAKAAKPKVVSVADAHMRAQAGDLIIIDVRMPEEWAATGMPEGAEGLTLGSSEFAATLSNLCENNPEMGLAMFCKSGMRSDKAAKFALAQGCEQVEVIAGGMEAWAKAQLPTNPFEKA